MVNEIILSEGSEIIAHLEGVYKSTEKLRVKNEKATDRIKRLENKWDNSKPYSISRIFCHFGFYRNDLPIAFREVRLMSKKKKAKKFFSGKTEELKRKLAYADPIISRNISIIQGKRNPYEAQYVVAYEINSLATSARSYVHAAIGCINDAEFAKFTEMASNGARDRNLQNGQKAGFNTFVRGFGDYSQFALVSNLEGVKTSVMLVYSALSSAASQPFPSQRYAELAHGLNGSSMIAGNFAAKALDGIKFLRFLSNMHIVDEFSAIRGRLIVIDNDLYNIQCQVAEPIGRYQGFEDSRRAEIAQLVDDHFSWISTTNPSVKDFLDKSHRILESIKPRTYDSPYWDQVFANEGKFLKRVFVGAAIGASVYFAMPYITDNSQKTVEPVGHQQSLR